MNPNSKAVAHLVGFMVVKWAIIYGIANSIRKAVEKQSREIHGS